MIEPFVDAEVALSCGEELSKFLRPAVERKPQCVQRFRENYWGDGGHTMFLDVLDRGLSGSQARQRRPAWTEVLRAAEVHTSESFTDAYVSIVPAGLTIRLHPDERESLIIPVAGNGIRLAADQGVREGVPISPEPFGPGAAWVVPKDMEHCIESLGEDRMSIIFEWDV